MELSTGTSKRTIPGRIMGSLNAAAASLSLLACALLFAAGCRNVKELVYSPDGRFLAEVQGESLSIYTLQGDRETIEVCDGRVFGASVSWSADARKLYFTRVGDGLLEVVAYDVVDGEKTVLAPHPARDWHPVAVGGEGVLFLSARDTLSDVYLTSPQDDEVRRLTRDDHLERLLCSAGEVRRYAYVSTDVLGKDSVVVADIGHPIHARIDPPGERVSELALSPDGSWLGIVADGEVYLCEIRPHDLASLIRWKSRKPRLHRISAGYSLAWSGDGRSIAYLTDDALVVRRLGPFSKTVRLLEGRLPRNALAFCPVRMEVAYAARLGDGAQEGAAVAVVNAAGTRRWLTRSAEELEVAAWVARAEGKSEEALRLLGELREAGLTDAQVREVDVASLQILEEFERSQEAIEMALGLSPPDYSAAGRISLLQDGNPRQALHFLSQSAGAEDAAYIEAIRQDSGVLATLVRAERALREGLFQKALDAVNDAFRRAPELAWTERLAFRRAGLAVQAGVSPLEVVAYHFETLQAYPRSRYRDTCLVALGRSASRVDRDPDVAAGYFTAALRATHDPSARARRFLDAVFDLAEIADLTHFEILIGALAGDSSAPGDIGKITSRAVDILDSFDRHGLANKLLKRLAAKFDLALSDLTSGVRVIEFVDRSVVFGADTTGISPWLRERVEIMVDAAAQGDYESTVRRFAALVLETDARPAGDEIVFEELDEGVRDEVAAIYAFLRGVEALRLGQSDAALSWLYRGASLSSQGEFARAVGLARDLLADDPDRADEIIAWLTWEARTSAGPWGRFASDLRALPALDRPEVPCVEPLATARTALLRTRSARDDFLERFPGSVFEQEIEYRKLGLDAVFESRGGALEKLADVDGRNRHARLARYRRFLRTYPTGPYFPKVFGLLIGDLREDFYAWRAAGEARELLDVVRFEGERGLRNKAVVLFALGEIYLDDLHDEAKAYEYLERVAEDFSDHPQWPRAVIEAVRIEKVRAQEIALKGTPPARELAAALLRKAIGRLNNLAGRRPEHSEVRSGNVAIFEADCTLAMSQLLDSATLLDEARSGYVRIFAEFREHEHVADGSLLVRLFSVLSDEDLTEIVGKAPSVLAAALDELDAWQKSRAKRLFPGIVGAEAP